MISKLTRISNVILKLDIICKHFFESAMLPVIEIIPVSSGSRKTNGIWLKGYSGE
jgi:hypothetical protein